MTMVRKPNSRSANTVRHRWSMGMAALCAIAILIAAVPSTAPAADMPEFPLVMQNHKFEPDTLKVPADTRFKLLVTNKNPMPSEFESAEFNREKIVLPDTTVTVFIGPLKPGKYRFFDDFHQETKGLLVVE